MLEKKKQELINYAKKMSNEGLVRGTGGNISYFDRDSGYMVITPSGMDYFELTLSDIPVVDLDGNVIEGERKPSSEYELHRKIYQTRDDINALIHVHSTYLTALATLREDLPASSYMIALTGDKVPCTEYATFGTKELAENAAKGMEGRKAVLLANHGAVAGDTSLGAVYNLISELEECAKIYLIAKSAGNPVILDEKEVERLEEKFNEYGQK